MPIKTDRISIRSIMAVLVLLLTATVVLVLPTQANHAGDALAFDGLDDFVQLQRTNTIMGGTQWASTKTISVWLKPDPGAAPETTPAEGEIIVGNDRPRTYGITRANYNGVDRIWVWNVDANGLDLIGVEYTAGEWVQIALVHGDGALTAYKNGNLIASVASDATYLPSSNADGTAFLGGNARADSIASFQGEIDEVRFWNVALTTGEIQDWLLIELDSSHPSYAELAAYYLMSDGAGTSLSDDSGSGNTGTLNGGMTDSNWVESGALHDSTLPPTNTPVPSFTPTETVLPPTETPTSTPTATPTNNLSTETATAQPPDPTATQTPTDSPPTATFTPTPTSLPPTATFTPTAEPPTPTYTNTPTSTPTPDTGAAGYALAFDGSTDFVILNETANIFESGWESTKSVSFWVRPDSWEGPCDVNTPAWCPAIFGDRPRWWGISIGEIVGVDRIWVWNYDGSSSSPTEMIPIEYTPGEWVHVALVHDAGELRAYRNGALAGTLPSGSTVQPNTGAHPVLHFGGIIINSSRNWTFDGAIDELRLWSRARSQSEIQADLNRTLTGSETGLSAYYQMSDSSGTSLTDDSQNEWTGTLHDGNGDVLPDGTLPVWTVSDAPIGVVQPTSTPAEATETPTVTPVTLTPSPGADSPTPEPHTPTPVPPTATSAPPTSTPIATATGDPSTATPTPTSGPGLQQVGNVDTPGYSYDLALAGSTLYVADTSGGLRLIDVADPYFPVELGSSATPNRAYGVSTDGSIAYVTATQAGLLLVDVTDPSSPDLLSTFSDGSYAWHVELRNGYAFLTDRLDGLYVIDVQDPGLPQQVAHIPTSDQSLDIAFHDHYAYLADFRAGVKIIDIADPTNPVIVSTLSSHQTYGLNVDNGLLYLADGTSGMQIYDLSDPRNPSLLGEFPTSGSMRSVDLYESTAYIADWNLGLFAIDISSPSNPALLDRIDTPGRAVDVLTENNLVYLADYEGGVSIYTGP